MAVVALGATDRLGTNVAEHSNHVSSVGALSYVNSMKCGEYMCSWTESWLVEFTICRLLGARPISWNDAEGDSPVLKVLLVTPLLLGPLLLTWIYFNPIMDM